VARWLLSQPQRFSWSHGIVAGIANAVLGVGLYFLLDKLKQRT